MHRLYLFIAFGDCVYGAQWVVRSSCADERYVSVWATARYAKWDLGIALIINANLRLITVTLSQTIEQKNCMNLSSRTQTQLTNFNCSFRTHALFTFIFLNIKLTEQRFGCIWIQQVLLNADSFLKKKKLNCRLVLNKIVLTYVRKESPNFLTNNIYALVERMNTTTQLNGMKAMRLSDRRNVIQIRSPHWRWWCERFEIYGR